MKTALKNITVVKVNENSFNILFGKGKGRVRGNVASIDEAVLFDKNFHDLEYKLINQVSTGKGGGAWFFKSTGKMFSSNHPFGNDFILA